MTTVVIDHLDNRDKIAALGIFLLALSVYILLSPGRIDIIDGQWRYEVAHNIIWHGSVGLSDSVLVNWGPVGPTGEHYSVYGLSGSIVAIPLLMLANLFSFSNRDLEQAFFSMTSPVFSAATLALLYVVFRTFGASKFSALAWALVFGFTTLFLPLATSSFDQAQHAFFILASFYCAYLANKEQRIWLAVLGGIAFIALIHFKDAYIVLWPGLLWTAGLNHPSNALKQAMNNRTIQINLAAGIIGLATWFCFNLIRFGQPLLPYVPGRHPPVTGNLFVGLAGLTLSPGKGLLWYSPAVLLVFFGWRRFWSEHTDLAKGIALSAGIWTTLIASLSFYGGDWCWGPRYWVPVLPLLFLPVAFVRFSRGYQKIAATVLIATSLCIQCLAVSVDHQRFFFANGLVPFFWYENDSFYFENSALNTRLAEIGELKRPDKHKYPMPFRPGPYPDSLTYAVFGPSIFRDLLHGNEWMERYPVFSLPRPWPFWTMAIENDRLALLRSRALAFSLALSLCGLLLLRVAFKQQR